MSHFQRTLVTGAAGRLGAQLRLSGTKLGKIVRLSALEPCQNLAPHEEDAPADLADFDAVSRAVEGSDIVYLTAGLPMDTRLWVEQWPVIMRNVIDACAAHGARLVFFDNTYMYPQTAEPQTESMRFESNGEKGRIRAAIAADLLAAMENGRVSAMICRAPEFYGPGKTQSITNSAILEPLRDGKTARVFLRDDTLRSLIFTPDASQAMALLGNTPDAYGQTWHLPCDDDRLTYRDFIALAARTFGTEPRYAVLKRWQLRLAGLFSPIVPTTSLSPTNLGHGFQTFR